MKFYKVTKKEITYQYIYVQANTKAHAREIAQEVDSEGWREGFYECNTLNPVIASPDEMDGHYIETDETAFIYKKK